MTLNGNEFGNPNPPNKVSSDFFSRKLLAHFQRHASHQIEGDKNCTYLAEILLPRTLKAKRAVYIF